MAFGFALRPWTEVQTQADHHFFQAVPDCFDVLLHQKISQGCAGWAALRCPRAGDQHRKSLATPKDSTHLIDTPQVTATLRSSGFEKAHLQVHMGTCTFMFRFPAYSCTVSCEGGAMSQVHPNSTPQLCNRNVSTP